MNSALVRKIIFFIILVGLFYLVGRIFYPFLTIILWSGLLYAFLGPIYDRLTKPKDGGPQNTFVQRALAAAFSLGSVLLIAVPVVFLGIAMVRQLGEMATELKGGLESNAAFFDLSPQGPIGGFVYRTTGGAVDLSSIDLKESLGKFLAMRSETIISSSAWLLRHLLPILVGLTFMIFTLYFLFVDGRDLLKVIVRAIPIERGRTETFIKKLGHTGTQLIKGYLLVALLQSSLMLVLCMIFRVKGALVVACLTAIATFVPMVGTALVWLPVSVAKAMEGDLSGAILFFFISGASIWALDSFVRPILLHDRIKIHPLLILYAILGGLLLFGFDGLLLGPLVLMLLFAAMEMFDQIYDEKTKVEDTQA